MRTVKAARAAPAGALRPHSPPPRLPRELTNFPQRKAGPSSAAAAPGARAARAQGRLCWPCDCEGCWQGRTPAASRAQVIPVPQP